MIPDPPFWRQLNAPSDWACRALGIPREHGTHDCDWCELTRIVAWLLWLKVLALFVLLMVR